ncbi:MAG: immunoglobulin domain-containing protein [Bacteroidales bacterium]|nr:immunoglobulin domain-containing protein [Bacteroidales bacterium]
MRKTLVLCFSLLLFAFVQANAQSNVNQVSGEANTQIESPVVHPTHISQPIYFDVSPPLRDLPVETNRGKLKRTKDKRTPKHKLTPRADAPFADDPVLQKGTVAAKATPIIVANFAGQTNGSFPPDCNGAIGPSHFFQCYNTAYTIYNKTGSIVAGPTNFNTLFTGVTGASYNDGDPIILWDEQANRWFAAEFSISGPNDYMLIAVSQTSDPTGSWYRWSYDVDDTPDYMKFGVTEDAYTMTTNTGGTNKDDVYAFDRAAMLANASSPTMIRFDNPNRPTTLSGFHCIMPVDVDGAYPPSGTPAMFLTINDNGWGSGNDELWYYEMVTDWTTPANSTFSRVQQISVSPFDAIFNSTSLWEDIDQPGTSQNLDALSEMLMYGVKYRNFGPGDEHIVCSHAIDVGSSRAGVRWYELTKSGSTWSIRQSGTYAPSSDAYSRWNSSIAMNGNKEIGISYSVASSSKYPSLSFTGQSQAEYGNASGVFDVTETEYATGTTYQGTYERWGDYAQMSVDPTDDNTFWYTSEYMINNNHSTKNTKIIAFRFQNDDNPSGLSATAVAYDQIDLAWSLNGSSDPVLVAWSPTGTFGTPANGTAYTPGNSIPGGGTVLTYGTSTSYSHTGLTANTTYYYKAWSNTGSYTWTSGVTANATTPSDPGSTLFTWDFESSNNYTLDFTPWTTVDQDADSTYGSSDVDFTGETSPFAWMCMNPTDCGWDVAQGDVAHGGTRCGMAICPKTGNASEDWFISPQMTLGTGSSFSLWVLSPKPGSWGNDEYEIYVSTTNNQPASFTRISSADVEAPATWTKHTYDLATYDNQTIYLAIKHVSTNMFMMWMDDLEVISTVTSGNSATIATQPSSTSACTGTGVSFTVSASGDPTITYQWQKDGTNISGATSSTYSIASVAAGDVGDYRCIVTNSYGSDTSNVATLTLSTAPSITSQPAAATQCEGTTATFTVAASGTATLSYQWKKNGSNITGATANSHTIVGIAPGDAGNYSVDVTNTCGTDASNNAALTVNSSTSITTQPVSLNANIGDNVSFSVVALGTSLTYQWQKDGSPLSNGGNITGATSSTLNISNVQVADYGSYTCVVSGTCGNENSNPAILTILTAINDLSDNQLPVYPNPSDGKFFVDFGTDAMSGKMYIIDETGRIVMYRVIEDENTIMIDLTNRAQGFYFLKIDTENQSFYSRLMLK